MVVRDEDGGDLASFQTTISSEGQAPPGTTPSFNHILPIVNMKFPKAGHYEFAFFLNERYDRSINLSVVKVSQPS